MKRALSIPLLLLVCAAPAAAEVVASADGTEIRYDVRGEGDPTLVFIHGWSCDRGYWREQVEVFAADHRVVALDLAGHGDSGTGRDEHSIAAFGADVVAVLAALESEHALLVGHSMGGPVAVEAALAAPGRVRGIIAVDTLQDMQATYPEEQTDAFLAMLEADFEATTTGWVASMFPPDADQDLAGKVAADMASAPSGPAVDAIRHTLAWMNGGGVPRLKGLEVNLVAINDDTHATNVDGNREVVPGYRAWIMEQAGHFPMLVRPGEFNELLAEAVAGF